MADRTVYLDLIGRDKVSKATNSAGKSVGGLGSKVEATSKRAKVALAGMAAGAVVMAKQSIDAASDLNETISKSKVVLGSAASSVMAWSKTSATSLGQSQQQALDAATSFAVFGKSAGLSGNDLAGFSTKMTGLASDMASFSNTSPEQAIEAIGAALRGETEPIRAYGVMLDDATMRQEAMKLGLIKTTKQGLTPQQKVLAAQSLILKQTKDAQGDFARTSDGLANKQRIAAAQVQNLKAKIGQGLLPVALKGVTVLTKMATWVEKNQTKAKVLAAAIVTVTAAVAGINAVAKIATGVAKAWAAAQWLINVALTANPIGIVIVAIAALAAGIVIAYKKSSTFRAVVQGAFQWIKSHWPLLLGIITGPIGLATVLIIKNWTKIKAGAQILAEAVKQSFYKIGLAIGKTILKVLDVASKIPGIGNKFKSARDSVRASNTSMQRSIDRSKAKVNSLKNSMSGIRSKTVTITVNTKMKNQEGYFDVRNHGAPRAAGGPVTAGVPYWVGERGPELVIPGQSGRVMSSSASGRIGGGGDVHVHIHTPVAVGSSREFRDAVVAAMRQAGGRGVLV